MVEHSAAGRAVSVQFEPRIERYSVGMVTVSAAFGWLGIPAGQAAPDLDKPDPSGLATGYGAHCHLRREVAADNLGRPAVAPAQGWQRKVQKWRKGRD